MSWGTVSARSRKLALALDVATAVDRGAAGIRLKASFPIMERRFLETESNTVREELSKYLGAQAAPRLQRVTCIRIGHFDSWP